MTGPAEYLKSYSKDGVMQIAVMGACSELIWSAKMLATSTNAGVRAAAGVLLQRVALLQGSHGSLVILSPEEMMSYAKRIVNKISGTAKHKPAPNQRTAEPEPTR